ncbi:MAG: PilZ domain-containing protein [Immundisolibacteraceae bacterium]|nr:PilZ domain-containing protein [Immundisolibacteraceae bacterium]
MSDEEESTEIVQPEELKKPQARRSARPGVLSLALKDKAQLYSSFMSYIVGGGLFIPTKKSYSLGEEVFLLLTLPAETAKMPVAGKIIWITPAGAQGGKLAGIGIQLADDDSNKEVRNKIEALIAGALNSNRPTYTM